MHLEIIGVSRKTLQEIRDLCYVGEGFASPAEFEAYWTKLHPRRGWQPERLVWLHLFLESDTHTGREVVVPFKPEMQKLILSGMKYLTTRTKKYGKPGDWFAIKQPWD